MSPSLPLRALAGALIGCAVLAPNARAQEPVFPVLLRTNDWRLTARVQTGVNAVAETNLFWNLADVPQLDFDSDTQWLESYLKSGLRLEGSVGRRSTVYATLTGVVSSTLGTDAFAARNASRATLEEAHVGYRAMLGDSTAVDLSLGPRELRLGTGMLIANGGTSGFERGALKLGPRKAWEMAAIGELSHRALRGRVFYLDPNELPSNDTRTRLVGADVSRQVDGERYVGATYVRVLSSNSPYPQAGPGGQGPATITFGAREGLNALGVYARTLPSADRAPGLFAAVDAAYEWNERIDLDAWGARLQVGYQFRDVRWTPSVTGSYQLLSGDDPDTPGLERFDPLYYEGSPSAWSTGSKSSMVFINSNVQSFGLSTRLAPSPRDIVTLRYAHIAAHRLRSPLQFGQAERVDFADDIPTVVTGVTARALANDMLIEYNRVVTRNVFVNAGFSVSRAGTGIRSLVGRAATWTGGFFNVVVNY